jgi:PTH1 family peptidyl-tRNA hydrolase
MIKLVAGLGNPGPSYDATRHNAGFWFVDAVAAQSGAPFRRERRFGCELAEVTIEGNRVRLIKPQSYMNLSGSSIAGYAGFLNLDAEQILVCHDDLDLPAGAVRLKLGGGHGGHNGLRDIVAKISSNDFLRLRFGIGRPTMGEPAESFVLRAPPAAERQAIDEAILLAVGQLPVIVAGNHQAAMNILHRHAAASAEQGPLGD